MIGGDDPVEILQGGLAWAKEINDTTLDRTKFALLMSDHPGPEVTQANLINSALRVPQDQLAIMYAELAWRFVDPPLQA